MNPITVTLICFGIIALMVLIVYIAIRKGKQNAESLQHIRSKHDLIVGEASPYVIAKAVGEYNQKYSIVPEQHEVIIMYVRK